MQFARYKEPFERLHAALGPGEHDWDAIGQEMRARENLGDAASTDYVVFRVDGVGFSKYVKRLRREGVCDDKFCGLFAALMDDVAQALLKHVGGAVLAYTHSDEVSVVVAPPRDVKQSHAYNGRMVKRCTVVAGLATGAFHAATLAHMGRGCADDGAAPPHFDCRMMTFGTQDEVSKYLLWRRYDCIRNGMMDFVHWRKKGLVGADGVSKLGSAKRYQWISSQGMFLPERQWSGAAFARRTMRFVNSLGEFTRNHTKKIPEPVEEALLHGTLDLSKHAAYNPGLSAVMRVETPEGALRAASARKNK